MNQCNQNFKNFHDNIEKITFEEAETEETPMRGPNSKKSVKKWSKEEDDKLIDLAYKTNGKKWKWIAKHFLCKKDTQCRSRWERIRPGMKQGRWTVEEDQLLKNLIIKYGDKWSEIAKQLENRTGKQVRDRIKNVLDTNLSKEEFTSEDDELIYKIFLKRGPKWKSIRDDFFPYRTADFIKNRFYSHYRRMIEKFKTEEKIDQILKEKNGSKSQELSLNNLSTKSDMKLREDGCTYLNSQKETQRPDVNFNLNNNSPSCNLIYNDIFPQSKNLFNYSQNGGMPFESIQMLLLCKQKLDQYYYNKSCAQLIFQTMMSYTSEPVFNNNNYFNLLNFNLMKE